MDFLTVWPSMVCLVVLYAVAATPLLGAADSAPSPAATRNAPLDGLRGFLALAVVLHHGAIYHGYLANGSWARPPSRFYTGLGEGGVSMFFMVTGYLFWRKVLNEQERGGVDWIALAVGRLFRIAPIFFLATIPMLLFVGYLTRWTLNEPWSLLVWKVVKAFSLGIYTLPAINEYQNTFVILAGVTWSLQYEWAFYLSLPFLALVLKIGALVPSLRQYLPWLLPVAVMVGCLIMDPQPDISNLQICAALFCIGMVAAACRPFTIGANWMRSSVVLLLVAIALTEFPSSYEAGPILLFGMAFLLISSGCTVFGVLTARPAIRLGDISYGIYLLQGLALAAVYWPVPLQAFALWAPIGHWLLFMCAALVLIGIATAAHVYIERPGIVLGRDFIKAMRVRIGFLYPIRPQSEQ